MNINERFFINLWEICYGTTADYGKSKIERRKQRVENLKVNEKVHRRIVQSLSNIYTSVYYIDLFLNQYIELASVDAKGVVTAKKKGICHIYVYAQNGLYKTVRIEVK